MNIEEMYRQMKLNEAAGSRSNDSDVGDSKTPGKLPDEHTGQPAKAEHPKAGNPGGPEKLPDAHTGQPGSPNAGKASKKTSTDAGKTKEDLEPPAGGIGKQADVTDADDVVAKDYIKDMLKKSLGEADLQEKTTSAKDRRRISRELNKGDPDSDSYQKAYSDSIEAEPQGKGSLTRGKNRQVSGPNSRQLKKAKRTGNTAVTNKAAYGTTAGDFGMKGSNKELQKWRKDGREANESIEELYQNFIAEYEAVLEENGIYEYDEEEAMNFFAEQYSELLEAKEEEEDEESEEEEKNESFQFKLADQLGSLLESEGLTDEFKSQATTIFEAAVNAASKSHIESIQDQLQEQFDSEIETYKAKLDEQVEKYLDYVVEEWVKENRLAVESASRNNIAESFMSKLKNLLEEHYVQLPEEKADLYEAEVAHAAELETELNESIEAQRKLSEQVKALEKKLVVENFVRELSEIEAEKIRELAEGVDFDNGFETKLKTLKENFFPSRKATSAQVIVEDSSPAVVEKPTTKKILSEMDIYLDTVNKMHSFKK